MAFDIETLNEVVNSYVADVREAMPIDHAYLFGSYAKGTATEHSDIDLCFFSPSFEGLSSFDIMKRLFRLTWNYGAIDIQPIGFPTSDLETDNPFVKEVLRTGREIV